MVNKYSFEKYDDPFRAFSIQMSIICDLEQGGKIDENEAFEQVKALYKQFKHYFKHEHEAKSILENEKNYEDNKYDKEIDSYGGWKADK